MTMAGITTRGQTDNVTVEGIHFTNCVCILSGATNVTVRYNTFQHFSTFAVRLCSVCGSTNAPINNIKVLYNQIDHVFYCFAAGGHGGGWTFSHNVCGPGIGEGGDPDAHYVQVIGNDNVTVDNNAFEGPFDVHALAAGAHKPTAPPSNTALPVISGTVGPGPDADDEQRIVERQSHEL